MRSSRPSLQYESPRPESWRGAVSPRGPSRSACDHMSSPVAASTATTARRVPTVEYSTPRAISGVPSILLRPRTEVLGLEAPRDLELVEVARVDLIERGVARVGDVAAVGCPLPVACADLPDLADSGQRRPADQTRQREDRQPAPTNRLPHDASVISYRGRSPCLYTMSP